MAWTFLRARWSNLFLLNYAVSPALLAKRVPAGLELDLRDGQAFVSLVAFDFLDTRVLGVPWPGYRNFAELNLRFYVRRHGERGVVFIREIVPQRLVAWLARVLYNEAYVAAPLVSTIQETADTLTATRQLTWGTRTYSITVTGSKPATRPGEESVEHFFKEHHWGYVTGRNGRTRVYRVDHPVWEVYPVLSYHLDFDWADVYGPEWEFLARAGPHSMAFALGSPITVSSGWQAE
jgi:uncharacterized protein YqjF (DUF2071 family)